MSDIPLDRIHIRDLACRCIVGINEEERTKKQDVCINITLHADLRRACTSDCIDDTVDYKAVKQSVLALVESSSFFLVERLADAIARVCFLEPLVQRADVTIDKPGALRFARSVAVSITREREENEF
jgi:FolB domain-containing protein